MAGLKVKKYSGDARMAELLSECGCSRPLDFVKAAVLGAQSSAEEFGVDNVARELLDGRKGVRVTEELIGELEGLWYLLFGSSRFPASDHITLDITTTGRDTVSGFVSRQVDAGDEFLKYLHHGRTQDFFDAPKLKKIYSVFNGNLEILRALHGSMTEKWSDEDFRDMESLARKLNSFIKVYWDSIVAIKELVKSRKLEKMKNRSIIRDIESQLQREIGRNDPCPCGSGKKYKACCGR